MSVRLSLVEQRLALRRQLSEQREIIAVRLTPARLTPGRLNPENQLQRAAGESSAYPRSLTMRWLTENPEQAITLAFSVATWLFGARFSGVIKDSMQFLKMVRVGATLH